MPRAPDGEENSLSCPQFWKTALNSGKVTKPLKMVNFDAQKSEFEPRKKSLSPNPYENPLFAKNGVQIGQILPLWAHLYFTPGYRGLPPCTLSQHPDNRETGYSNVLGWGRSFNFSVNLQGLPDTGIP